MKHRRRAAAMAAAILALTYGLLAGQSQASAAEKPEELTIAKLQPYSPHHVFVPDISFGEHDRCARSCVRCGRRAFHGPDRCGLRTGLRGVAGSQDELRRDDLLRARRTRRAHRRGRDDRQHDARRDRRNRDSAQARQAVPTPYNTTLSADGSRLYVSNITPSTSVTVIDTATKKVLGEIDTDACVLAYPSGNDRFTSLCESGKALTVKLDAAGKEAAANCPTPSSTSITIRPSSTEYATARATCSPRTTATFAALISPATRRSSAKPGRWSARPIARRAGVRAACSKRHCTQKIIVCL